MAAKVFQSPLLVIPSIDIKDGKLVRIVQGIPHKVPSVYPDDPGRNGKNMACRKC